MKKLNNNPHLTDKKIKSVLKMSIPDRLTGITLHLIDKQQVVAGAGGLAWFAS